MDKDNSQESMISSNSPSFGKSRGEAYYSSNPTFYVGIDCIIFGFNEGEISLLLLKRNFEPAMGEWSLMGGFVQNNESVDDAAKRVLHELTGLENVYMEQVGTFGAIDRDPGERVISVAYAFSSDKENAMNAGATEVLVKPITLSILRTTLSKYLPDLQW